MPRRQLSASNPTSGSSVQALGACVVVGVLGPVVGPPGVVVVTTMVVGGVVNVEVVPPPAMVVVVTVVVLVVAQFSQHGSDGFSTWFGSGAASMDGVKV